MRALRGLRRAGPADFFAGTATGASAGAPQVRVIGGSQSSSSRGIVRPSSGSGARAVLFAADAAAANVGAASPSRAGASGPRVKSRRLSPLHGPGSATGARPSPLDQAVGSREE